MTDETVEVEIDTLTDSAIENEDQENETKTE